MHTYITHMHTCICSHPHVPTLSHTYTLKHTHIYTHGHMYMHPHRHIHMFLHSHSHTYTDTRVCSHSHTHIHTLSLSNTHTPLETTHRLKESCPEPHKCTQITLTPAGTGALIPTDTHLHTRHAHPRVRTKQTLWLRETALVSPARGLIPFSLLPLTCCVAEGKPPAHSGHLCREQDHTVSTVKSHCVESPVFCKAFPATHRLPLPACVPPPPAFGSVSVSVRVSLLSYL